MAALIWPPASFCTLAPSSATFSTLLRRRLPPRLPRRELRFTAPSPLVSSVLCSVTDLTCGLLSALVLAIVSLGVGFLSSSLR
jgi:hypothetical protein